MTDATQEFEEAEGAAAGDLIDGRYRLEEPLSGGVTATTWRAHDPVLGRDIAVKIWADSSEDARRSQEDELGAARLLDPNLNSLLDAGTHEGRPFLVRELALEHPVDSSPPLSASVALPSPQTDPSAPITPPSGLPEVRAKRRDRVVMASVGAAVIAALLVVGGLLVRPDASETAAEPVAGEEIAPVEIMSFDPEGDGRENPEELPALLDGNPATTWSSDRYNSRKFGNLKPGFGLVLTLDPARSVSSLELESETAGWSAQIHTADQAADDFAGWGQPIGTVAGARPSEELDLGGRTVGAVLIWFTDLGPESNRLTLRDLRVNAVE